jgi:hypothetical protein
MMKYFKLLPMAVIVVLMVVMVGCTTIRDASGEYGDVPSRRRVYYENPYYGNTIILERDPYTGQLYQISPYGYSPLNTYGYNYYPYNNNGVYHNRDNRGGTVITKPSQPRNERSNQSRQNFEDARNKVLGGKKQ